MTFIDLIKSLPTWLQIAACILVAVWAFQFFMFPFRINVPKSKVIELLELQRQTLEELQKKDIELQRTHVMLSTVMSLLLKREQREEDSKNKDVKKDA